MQNKEIYTIGHSNIDIDKFINLLKLYKIQIVIDVRSFPYSKYTSQFNRENLKSELEKMGIDYIYLGDYLGGKTAKGSVDYIEIEKSEKYQESIDKLIKIAERRKTVIMCSEADYNNCHRNKLIAQTLMNKGISVKHILSEGKVIGGTLDLFHIPIAK